MSKNLEFKKCKMCQQTRWGENNCWSNIEFMVDGQFYCLSCLEKKGTNCRWCHKSISMMRECSQCVYDGSGLFGGEVDTSTICCLDCLHKFEYEKDEWGHDKRIESDRWKKCQKPGCEYIISRHEEAIGYDEYCRSCAQEKKNRKKAEESKNETERYFQALKRAQDWWSALSSSEREQECERVVENMKLGKYWANNVEEGEASGSAKEGFYIWRIKSGKFVSDTPHKVPIQIAEEFEKKELGTCYSGLVVEQGFFTQKLIKDNPPLEIENKERSGEKKIEIIDNNKGNNEVLVIDLKRIKKISLRNNDQLEIEFNSVQNSQNDKQWYSVKQVINDKQVDNNQKFKTIKNYLRENGRNSLNQQELAKFFDSSSIPTETPKDISRLLKIGGGAVLVFGLLGWLLVVSKRKLKKH